MTGRDEIWEWDGGAPEPVDPAVVNGDPLAGGQWEWGDGDPDPLAGDAYGYGELPADAVARFAFGQPIGVQCTECGTAYAIIIEPDGDLPPDATGSREIAVTCDNCGETAWLTLVLAAPE